MKKTYMLTLIGLTLSIILVLLTNFASGSSWERLPGAAKDIGIGADGSVWVIGTNGTGGGYGIYKWQVSGWSKIDGGAVQISVDNNGISWVVNSGDQIYRCVN